MKQKHIKYILKILFIVLAVVVYIRGIIVTLSLSETRDIFYIDAICAAIFICSSVILILIAIPIIHEWYIDKSNDEKQIFK